MAGYADAFLEGFDRQFQAARSQRERELLRAMEKRRLQLAEAAAERSASRDMFERQQAMQAQERQAYTDRRTWMEQGTEPFKRLVEQYPEAGASDEVARIFQLGEDIARQPSRPDTSLLGPRGVVEGPPRPGYDSPAPGGVTRMGERQALIGEAEGLFGKAKANAEAEKHRRELAERRASNADSPEKAYTRDLEIEQRAIERLRTNLGMARLGYIAGPGNTWEFVNAMNDPKLRPQQEATIQQMEDELTARSVHLQNLQQRSFGRVTTGGDPQAYYNARRQRGIPPQQIVEEMRQRGMPVPQ